MTDTTIFRIPDVRPVHNGDGDTDGEWVMVRASDLENLEREHRLLCDVATAAAAYRDARSAELLTALDRVIGTLDELPIHLVLP